MRAIHPIARWIFLFFIAASTVGGIAMTRAQQKLLNLYALQQSRLITDRNGAVIRLLPNTKGYYMRPVATVPPLFRDLLIRKEDRFFFYHPGINPLSICRDLFSLVLDGRRSGSSTLTQQLIKTLVGSETKRTLANKISEAWGAVALEARLSKNRILTMYANTAYFGNLSEGLGEAAWFYFRKPPESLNVSDMAALLAALNSPSYRHPGTIANERGALRIAGGRSPSTTTAALWPGAPTDEKEEGARRSAAAFEWEDLATICAQSCRLTVDTDLTATLRGVLLRHLSGSALAGAENGAMVVLELPDNRILAVIGSPRPGVNRGGYDINMAVRPRPVGSTAKPFFYMKAFEKGVRPYTLIQDQEARYAIATGFEFYPRNYDGAYHGIVTLHAALANSLNIPSVRVLEYTGLGEFTTFLTDALGFVPIQPLKNYALGIALGGLEMDLLTLSHYYTIFPNNGNLRPLIVGYADGIPRYRDPPMAKIGARETPVAQPAAAALINKILADRYAGVEQFGLKSFLNIPGRTYALKTGTSRDYRDAWVIGYTPDFLVGAWIGNHDNTPMPQLTGASGAGRIWHDAMNILFNSSYNKNTPFAFDGVAEFTGENGSIEYGLAGDDFEAARAILIRDRLIIHPHDGDTLLFEPDMTIPLVAARAVSWRINRAPIGDGDKKSWQPKRPGSYAITAAGASEEETITITIHPRR